MAIITIDLGGTKIGAAVLNKHGDLTHRNTFLLNGLSGTAVGKLIIDKAVELIGALEDDIQGIGISVPGISRSRSGTVWAPNIAGWEDYPLLDEIHQAIPGVPVVIESDRACCILGEMRRGSAQGCTDAIYLTVGTGIGAGIMADGHILHGAHDIAGAIGWMALQKPFNEKYTSCGCFEYYASGDGIARYAEELLAAQPSYKGNLRPLGISAVKVFDAFELGDPLAKEVIQQCIRYWGMACANLISIFNPEKIIFGGGVFGPALQFLEDIKSEASQWAQPISMTQVSFAPSILGSDAPLYGAAYLVLGNLSSS